MIDLNGAIVIVEGERWLVEEASDLEAVDSAILHARVSGSVGSGLDTIGVDGKVKSYARVRRLIAVEYTVQGVYNAKEEPVKWENERLRKLRNGDFS